MEGQLTNGLIEGHAYSITAVREVRRITDVLFVLTVENHEAIFDDSSVSRQFI
jgi:hypothetical protein